MGLNVEILSIFPESLEIIFFLGSSFHLLKYGTIDSLKISGFHGKQA